MADILHPKSRRARGANNPKIVKYIRVQDAIYVGEYKVQIIFNDNTMQVVDFGPFLVGHPHPQYSKYLDAEQFKTFSIDMGNLVWGENWDLIFPVEQLYRGEIL